jgi:hypothetical protein
MTKHFLISFATDGVHDHGVDLTKQAEAFKSAGNSFDFVKVFTSEEVIAIACDYHVFDPLKNQTEAFAEYKRTLAILNSEFRCNPNYLKINAFLFKPLLVHYALHNIVGPDDLLTWHDCNIQKKPHYLKNVSLAGKSFLESCINGFSVSLFSDTLCGISFDIKPSLVKLIYELELSKVLPSFRANILTIYNDSFGRRFIRKWLDLSLNDNFRLPFPDDFPQPKSFHCHACDQATLFYAAAFLCCDTAFRKRLNHTFLWNSTRLPPRQWQTLGNLVRRSQFPFNLRLLKLIRHYPYLWHQFRDRIESTNVFSDV